MPARTSFELFVRRHLSPATVATFPVALMPTAVPRNTVRRLRVGADSDIAEIVGRLTERNVELLDIRRCPECPRRAPQQRAASAVPVEAGADVVALPVRPALGAGVPDPPGPADGEADAEKVSPIGLSRRDDGGARRAPRRGRRARG
jgi:hypothetical protein